MAPLIAAALAFVVASAPYAADVSTIVTGAKALVSVPCLVLGAVDPPAPTWCAAFTAPAAAPKAAMAAREPGSPMPAIVAMPPLVDWNPR